MNIELLLHNVSQDQRAPTGQSSFYGWMHGPSGGGTGGDKGKRDKDKKKPCDPPKDDEKKKPPVLPKQEPASMFNFRKESWGGVVICMTSQKVYVVDEEAYVMLSSLKNDEMLYDFLSSCSDSTRIDIERLEEMLDFGHIM